MCLGGRSAIDMITTSASRGPWEWPPSMPMVRMPPRRPASTPDGGILDDDAAGGRHLELLGSAQEDVGRRLAVCDFLGRHGGLEHIVEVQHLDEHVDAGGRRR